MTPAPRRVNPEGGYNTKIHHKPATLPIYCGVSGLCYIKSPRIIR